MSFLKIAAAIMLVLLFSAAGWVLSHLQQIKCDLLANDLMPRPTPRRNFLFLLTVAFIALSGLLIGFLLN